MRIQKKVSARSIVREHYSSSRCRSQRKTFWNVRVPGKRILKLIGSSAKKKCNSIFFPTIRDVPCSRDLDSKFFSAEHEVEDTFLSGDAVDGMNNDFKVCNGGIAHHALDTIFSPAFHISKYAALKVAEEGPVTNGMDMDSTILLQSSKLSRFQMLPPETNAVSSCCSEDLFDIDLPPISSPQHSDIGNVDEADDSVDTRDFSSYLFIRNLPDLSSVVPTYRHTLLPKQTRSCLPTTLVLDLDETLVHSQLSPISDADFTFPIKFEEEECTVYVRCRPHLKDFLEKVASLFEVVIFTASNRIYAEPLLNILDPKRKLLRHRLFRESCVFVGGSYLKDLSVLGRDLARVVILDNSPEAFGFQVKNGIQIESWFEDRCDQELVGLVPFLEGLARAEDVRPLIVKKFGLEDKIADAVILHSTLARE